MPELYALVSHLAHDSALIPPKHTLVREDSRTGALTLRDDGD